jgi:hypothetical protein
LATVVRTTPPTAGTTPAVAAAPVQIKANPKTTTATPALATPTVAITVPATLARPTNAATKVVAPPPTVPAPTLPPPPKEYGASVLTWTAPRTLTIETGHAVSLFVTAHNPTDGIASLPHPLSCAPRLDHSEVCSETVQPIGSGQSASAGYTIDAHGVVPGRYTLDIEGVVTLSVTVTPASA